MKVGSLVCVAIAATTVTFSLDKAHAFGSSLARPPHTESRSVRVQDQPNALFRGVGVVTAIDPETGSLTINHEDIPGLMSAMEMLFRVDPQSLSEGVRPGDKIEFLVDGKKFTIKELRVIAHSD